MKGNLENSFCAVHHPEVTGREEKCSLVLATKTLPVH